MDFDTWMEQLDTLFNDVLGMHRGDFDDWDWQEDFDATMSPEEAFAIWAEKEGYAHLI